MALLLTAGGCDGIRYVTHLLEGQSSIQVSTEPIDAVLASGRLSEDDESKLRLIVAAREFARDVIGLNAGNSYTQFYDTHGQPLIFNLSASRRDRLQPYLWVFPIVGSFPYLGFFDEDYLHEVEQDLIQDGYDTFIYESDAYSTLGILADPVRSPMLRRNIVSLADTIIHELTHNTVFRPNDTTFNETLATFVGQQGAIEFFTTRYDPVLGLAEFAQSIFDDQVAINQFLIELFNDLSVYYGGPGSPTEKIAGREAVYQRGRERFASQVQQSLSQPEAYSYYAGLPTNNAWMLLNQRYNFDVTLFREVYERTGRNWRDSLEVFRAAARSPGDPLTYLRDWLADS